MTDDGDCTVCRLLVCWSSNRSYAKCVLGLLLREFAAVGPDCLVEFLLLLLDLERLLLLRLLWTLSQSIFLSSSLSPKTTCSISLATEFQLDRRECLLRSLLVSPDAKVFDALLLLEDLDIIVCCL